MPQNRPQYTFGQLVSLVEELKSSVNSLRSDFDKIKEAYQKRKETKKAVELCMKKNAKKTKERCQWEVAENRGVAQKILQQWF